MKTVTISPQTNVNREIKMRTLACVLLIFVLVSAAAAQRDQTPEPSATLNFLVLKEDNGKPVRSAAVIMHTVSANGKQSKGGLELKTDADGKTSFENIPYGKLRVQVLASGFQTFGEDYEVNSGKLDLTIKLKRPQGQYSIYPDENKNDKTPPPDPNAKPQ
jgi:hypothetical protein